MQDRPARQFRAVVAHDHQRQPAHRHDRIQLARHTQARQRRVRHQAKALPRAVVHHAQHPEPPSVQQRVRHKVQRPPLVRAVRHRNRCPRPKGPLAAARGVRILRATATGFRVCHGRLKAVATKDGQLPCDKAVISAGIASWELARQAGDMPSLESERGYHVVAGNAAIQLDIPVQPSDTRMGMTLTDAGLRGAGQVELASAGTPPDWRRAGILLEHLKRAFPGLPQDLSLQDVDRWLGHRPSTPDGLPVIGTSSASPDIVHAFGHGHVGLASAPMTARLVAVIVRGDPPPVPVAAYCAQRFNHWWPRPAADSAPTTSERQR